MADPEAEEDVEQSTEKICLVCGDRALSCNFGAITCESCKAFFRRNAAKEWSSKCDGHCPITVETRSYCKKCRLLKCLEVGMNRSLILSEEQKKLRKQKIMENKIRRSGQLVSTADYQDMDIKRNLHVPPPPEYHRTDMDIKHNSQSEYQRMDPDIKLNVQHVEYQPTNTDIKRSVPHLEYQRSDSDNKCSLPEYQHTDMDISNMKRGLSLPDHSPPKSYSNHGPLSDVQLLNHPVMDIKAGNGGPPKLEAISPPMKTSISEMPLLQAVTPEVTHALRSDGTHTLRSDGTHALRSDGTHALRSDGTHTLRSDGTHTLRSDGTHTLRSDSTPALRSDGTHALRSDGTHTLRSDGTNILRSDNTHTLRSDNTHNFRPDVTETLRLYESPPAVTVNNMNSSLALDSRDPLTSPPFNSAPGSLRDTSSITSPPCLGRMDVASGHPSVGIINNKTGLPLSTIAPEDIAPVVIAPSHNQADAQSSSFPLQQPSRSLSSESCSPNVPTPTLLSPGVTDPSYQNNPLIVPAADNQSGSLRNLMSSEGPPQNYAHMFPQEQGYNPENKKLRIGSSDSVQSSKEGNGSSDGNSSSSEFPQTGIVATTLKVLMDSDNFRQGLQDLPDAIAVPDFTDIFNEANLTVDNWVFMKHISQLQYAASTAFTQAKKNNKCPKDPSYVQIFNFSESSIKCLVTLAKNLEPFLALTTDDQILLLKNSILEMMVLGSASSYDHKKKGWVIMDGGEVKTVQTTTVKSTKEGKILMGHYEMIILYVLSASRRDLGIIVLLTVLTLFSLQNQRSASEIQDRSKVEEGYKIYLNVLKIYTSIKYPDRPNMMENMMRSLDVVRDFSETYMQSILKSPLNKISPLLLEIFDLPNIDL